MKNVKVNLKSRKMLPKYTVAELTVLAERVGLTLPQLKAVQDAAHATYDYIGYDLEGGPHRRADLIEVLMDANYIESANPELDPALKLWLHTKASKYNLDDVYAAVGAAFMYPLYE